MSTYDLNALLLVLVALGVWGRGRAADCATFAIYVPICLATNRMMVWWPDVFLTQSFWLRKEWLYCALKAAIALELATQALASFPHARSRGLRLALAVSAAALLVAMLSSPPADYQYSLTVLLPRAQLVLVWAYVGLLGLIAWYRIPLDSYARAIVLGFLLYMGAYAGGLEAIRWMGAPGFDIYEALNPAAYAASVAVWALAAWRPRAQLALLPQAATP